MAIRFKTYVLAFAVCDLCGDDGPGGSVGCDHDPLVAYAAINGTRPPESGVIGARGEWVCGRCKTPAIEPRRDG